MTSWVWEKTTEQLKIASLKADSQYVGVRTGQIFPKPTIETGQNFQQQQF